jgi:hypothetical protein
MTDAVLDYTAAVLDAAAQVGTATYLLVYTLHHRLAVLHNVLYTLFRVNTYTTTSTNPCIAYSRVLLCFLSGVHSLHEHK